MHDRKCNSNGSVKILGICTKGFLLLTKVNADAIVGYSLLSSLNDIIGGCFVVVVRCPSHCTSAIVPHVSSKPAGTCGSIQGVVTAALGCLRVS